MLAEYRRTSVSVMRDVINDLADHSERVSEILSGVTTFQEFLDRGYQLSPYERVAVVNAFFPNLEFETIESRTINKTIAGGRRRRHRRLVVVGSRTGFAGLGVGKAVEVTVALRKAIFAALVNLNYIARGCGSFRCSCRTEHSLPSRRSAKVGSTIVEVLPASLGKGLLMSQTCRIICQLVGINDLNVNIIRPSNVYNTARAFFLAFQEVSIA